MRLAPRLIAATLLIALSGALAGCGTNGSFDPTDALDWFDTKKKLPGERRAVFPDGVPGVEQGVPKDLYKGANVQQQDQPPVASAPPPEPAPRRGTRTAARQPNSVAPSEQSRIAPRSASDAEPEPDDNAVATAPPAPAPKKPKRQSITAPEADAPQPAPQVQSRQAAPPQQQSAAPFPAPLPSGGFQR